MPYLFWFLGYSYITIKSFKGLAPKIHSLSQGLLNSTVEVLVDMMGRVNFGPALLQEKLCSLEKEIHCNTIWLQVALLAPSGSHGSKWL